MRDVYSRGEPVPTLLETALETFAEVTGLVDSAIQTVRRIATELRPSVLDTFGLVAAIEWQAEDFQKRTKTRCVYEGPQDLDVGRELSTTVFRICQEALTNVARHAAATEVRIRLAVEYDWLLIEVRDNGKGVSPATLAHTSSLGVLGMRERARIAGGELEIGGSLGQGVTVVARLPFKTPTETPVHADEAAAV